MTRVGVTVMVGLAVGIRVGEGVGGTTLTTMSCSFGAAVARRVAVGDPKHRRQNGSLELATDGSAAGGCDGVGGSA